MNNKFLNAFVKETLRLYPPMAPFVTRVAKSDYVYKGMTIPKGCGIFVGVYQVQTDPNLWSEPEKFDPTRFYEKYEQMAYQVFGNGPRNCVGLRFSYMETNLILANLLRKYRILPGPSTEHGTIETKEFFSTRIPKNGVFCKLVPLSN